MRWAWFALVVVALALTAVGGLYAAGPAYKTVTYFETVEREGYCAGETAEWNDPGGLAATEEECLAMPAELDQYCADLYAEEPKGDFPECGGSKAEWEAYPKGEWDVYWVPPRDEQVPRTRQQRTDMWERISGAVTGD
jgi:hypothetical protein